MGFPALMVRESVRMERATICSCLLFLPKLTITGAGILGFCAPIRLIDGTCLNFLVSITLICYFHVSAAKIGIIIQYSKEKPKKVAKRQALPLYGIRVIRAIRGVT